MIAEDRSLTGRPLGPARIGAAGTELALLSSPTVSPEAAAKPYQVEARIDAANKTTDAGVKLRLWQEALAIAPDDGRVRLGALRAALAAGRDSLALAMHAQPQLPPSATDLSHLADAERASIAESLAAAAERLDELGSAQNYLRVAIGWRPTDQRGALERKLQTLTAEVARRAQNAARRPVVKDVIEQDTLVRPRILRSAQ